MSLSRRLPFAITGLCLGLLIGIVLPISAIAQDSTPLPSVEQLHQELRDLRDRAEKALAAHDEVALLADFTDDMHFTAMDNETVAGKDAARAYYDRMLGSASSLITVFSATLEPDALSTLYDGGQVAVSTGSSTAHLKARAGVDVTLPLRWTATLVRVGGAWKVASVHFSANILANPFAGGVVRYGIMLGIAVLLIGLVIGFLFGRRKRAGG